MRRDINEIVCGYEVNGAQVNEGKMLQKLIPTEIKNH